tara:strand:+ start:259 stop:507 length:249 start_codon:yes stop_codon:yes gene_type:complete
MICRLAQENIVNPELTLCLFLMAKFDKYLKYKDKIILLPKKYLVEGGREEAIQLIQRAELLKEADLGDIPNLPSFVKKALED